MSSENPHSEAYLEANKGPAILGIVLTASILSTVFVFGRVFTRKRIIGALHLDDWFTVIAMVSSPRSRLSLTNSLTIHRSFSGAKSPSLSWLSVMVMADISTP